ncbi:MAG: FN3 associated domain-containing protein, partial [Fibrobacteria bacterium]
MLAQGVSAQPTVRVEKSYEDTVRILILYNSQAVGQGSCPAATRPVGPLTNTFTVNSVTGIPNVKVLNAETTQWSNVQAAFPGKLPHVIVHVNAGWYTTSGPYIEDVLNRAADLAIGVVSIGDDAAQFATRVFGFNNVDNVPAPMGDARQYTASNTKLWINLDGKSDTLPKPGVIRNTVDSLKVTKLDFKPYGTDAAGDYRCQADADKYAVLPEFLNRLSFLGFQRAFNGTDTIAGPRELQTIVAFQEEQRRGVALSFQPQFLSNVKAATQVVYDAIIYASYAHFYNLIVATPIAEPGTSSFLTQVNVTLKTSPTDATIYYTLDGTVPSQTGATSHVYTPGTPIAITGNTTIKAIAYKTGWMESGIMTETYTKTFKASTLEVADQNGRPLPGYLSDFNTAYTVRLNTTQAGLKQVTIPAATKAAGDAETLTLSNPDSTGTLYIFTGTSPLVITSTGISANAKTEAAVYDTLTVTWTNPKDPNDKAVTKVPVRPAPRQGFAYFSTKPDGSDTTDQFQGTETKIYLVVLDEVLPAGVTPKVKLETSRLIGTTNTAEDVATLPMSVVSPGKYIAAIPVALSPTPVADSILQLQIGDLIKATYTDPMDTEPPAVANAGFGVAPEIDASLQFTDKNYNPVASGIYYSPALDTL